MEPRDVMVVGGSAGSLVPMRQLVAALPPDLPAFVAVTMHVSEQARSRLPQILSRSAALPAAHAVAGEALLHGRIYVAPPGRHLLMPGVVAELSNGPRMNRTRPAVDAMFASAARWAGDRVVAVVLSGGLDDGAVGAALVAEAGGLVIVQEPAEAERPSMPRAALAAAPGAIAVPTAELGEMVSGMVGHVGHQFAPQVLVAAQAETAEAKLWTAVAALEETSALARHMAQHAGVAGDAVAQQSRTADWAATLAGSLRERFEEAPDSASRT